MIVTAVGVIVLGALYMITAKPYERGNSPAGDAHRSGGSTGGSVIAPLDA
jgi:hypothetical protein